MAPRTQKPDCDQMTKTFPLFISMLLVALTSMQVAWSETEWKILTRPQIKTKISGKRFHDDTHFDLHYKPDGTITGYSMGMAVIQNGVLKNDSLCIRDAQQEDCYMVLTNKNQIKLKHTLYDIDIYGLID